MGRRADPAGRRPLAVIRQRRRSRPGGCLLRRGRDTASAARCHALFKPVDIVAGPDGALYVSGWGEEYGAVWKDGEQANEGRIFRISWPGAPPTNWDTPKRGKPVGQWTIEELFDDLGSLLPVWSVDAQDELVRRGAAIKDELTARLRGRAD